MKSRDRQTTLKIVAGGCVGLLLLNWIVIGPMTDSWKKQGERIAELNDKVERGKSLLDREEAIRSRWTQMQAGDLPKDVSTAEGDAQKALGRWAGSSHITFTSLMPAWRNHPDEGYDTYECRISANGDQASLSRFLYELEVDPMPVALQECEITSRDTQGRLLMLNARFSFVRIAENTGTAKGARK